MKDVDFDKLKKRANAGDVESEYELGLCYEDGESFNTEEGGIKVCKEKALFWYQQAADHGHATAMASLGVMLSDDEGCEKNKDRALYWLKKAIRNDSDQWPAASNIAQIYWSMGNFRRSFYWLLKAVNMGDSDALFDVGWCYIVGKGVRRNYKTGKEYIEKAILSEFISPYAKEKSMLFLGFLYYNGCGVKRSIHLAKSWCEKTIERFDSDDARDLLQKIEDRGSISPIQFSHEWW